MRALISTYDKTGLDVFARGLAQLGWGWPDARYDSGVVGSGNAVSDIAPGIRDWEDKGEIRTPGPGVDTIGEQLQTRFGYVVERIAVGGDGIEHRLRDHHALARSKQ